MHLASSQSLVPLSSPITDSAARCDEPTQLDRLGDQIAEAAAHIDAAMHRQLEMIRSFDELGGYVRQGARSMAHWLSWRIGLTPVVARERVRVARALGGLPLISGAIARGELSYSKVRAMTRVATPQNEARLVLLAKEATGAELEKICRGLRGVVAAMHPGDPRAPVERWVRHRTTDSGMVRIEAQLHPDEAAVVLKALAEARRHNDQAGRADVSAEAVRGMPSADAELDFGAQQADALVQVADAFLAGARGTRTGGERTRLFVHLGPSLLDPESTQEATLQDGTPLAPESFRRLACDAALIPVRTGADGAVLDVGRQVRAIPTHILRALQTRDRTCRFPGCRASAFVDAHHVQHWAQGGETKLSNLLTLCRLHHTAVHEGSFRVEPNDAGAFVFYGPEGRALSRAPAMPAPRGASGEALAAIRERHAAEGLRIDRSIRLGSFRLEPVEYDAAIATLLDAEMDGPTDDRSP